MQTPCHPLALALLALSGIVGCGGATAPRGEASRSAQNAPEDAALDSAAALTRRAVAMFGEVGPELGVEADGELTLRPTRAPHEGLQINLDRIWSHCQREPDLCEASLEGYVRQVTRTLRERAAQASAPADAGQLLPVLRPSAYAQMVQERTGVAGVPFGADLVALVVLDSPTTAQPVDTGLLSDLGLSSEKARATASSQLRRRFEGFASAVQPPPEGALGRVEPADYYTSSLLLLEDDWARVAERFGRLLVSVPDPSTLLYVDGDNQEAAMALHLITRSMYEAAERPLSAEVFAWTDEGWRALSPAP